MLFTDVRLFMYSLIDSFTSCVMVILSKSAYIFAIFTYMPGSRTDMVTFFSSSAGRPAPSRLPPRLLDVIFWNSPLIF